MLCRKHFEGLLSSCPRLKVDFGEAASKAWNELCVIVHLYGFPSRIVLYGKHLEGLLSSCPFLIVSGLRNGSKEGRECVVRASPFVRFFLMDSVVGKHFEGLLSNCPLL